MSFITRLALSRRPVTILAIILLFGLGVYSYNQFQRELFPQIEFPNIFIVAIYPNSDPETVAKEVAEPIETAISGITGINQTETTSTSDSAVIVATFDFGTDMKEAQRDIESAVNGVNLPSDVDTPSVLRINSDTFPVMQFSISSDGDASSLQRVVDDALVPAIERVDGVGSVQTPGSVWDQVVVTAHADKLEDAGMSMQQLADAIAQNNASFPAGAVSDGGVSYPVRTENALGSLQDIRSLTVGFERTSAPNQLGARPVKVSDVADVELISNAWPVSRTNGKPSVALNIIKDPDANTVDVTDGVLAAIADVQERGAIPPDVRILTLNNSGPEVRELLGNLLREGSLGFLFAVTVVFIFLLNIRPSLLRGIGMSLRPTCIIAISIPLSILIGVLLLSLTDITLNFMSLAGLAIAVGRVVDDSIVVLENMYRHIQFGEPRVEAAYTATSEVGAAILSSTLTTVAIFLPLAFISGVVGEFFSPFAISVSLALIASTAVAVTAVPVLGVALLRNGDFILDPAPENDGDPAASPNGDTLLQRIYTPLLTWTLRHKLITILAALLITGGSLGLIRVIPITLFPSGAPEFLTIDIELPVGSATERANENAMLVEQTLERLREEGIVDVYQLTLGSSGDDDGNRSQGGHLASFFVTLHDGVAEDVDEYARAQMPELGEDATLTLTATGAGPPADGLQMTITGNNFNDIAAATRELEAKLQAIDGVANLSSSVSEGQDEVVINVDPARAGEHSLSAAAVGAQINQFIVGREISEINIEGTTTDIILRGDPDAVDNINQLKSLTIESQTGQSVKLGVIADIAIEQSPISVRTRDGERSAIITGIITAADTGGVGDQVDQARESIDLPPGVQIDTGGIFEQIAEGFQDVYIAMGTGVALVYLVMVATLGSLRTPFIIVLSLPLVISGALLALLLTGRTLSISAMMGFLLLIGIVVTNAIVLLTFVEQLRERGYGVYDALMEGARIRLRPILMTAFTTTFALVPLAASASQGGIVGAELATVVIGGMLSSTFLTLVVVPVVYMIINASLPNFFRRLGGGADSDGGPIEANSAPAAPAPSGAE